MTTMTTTITTTITTTMTTTITTTATMTTTVTTTIRMTDRRRAATRLPRRGAGLLLVVSVALSSCSTDDGDPAADSAAPITPAPVATTPIAATAAPTPPPATASPTAAALPLPDGPSVLLQSLDALAPGYHFVITAVLNGQVALTTEGDQIGLASRQTVTSQGVAVDYIVLPEGTWKGEGGVWEELEVPAPAVDPLAAFRSPTAVTVVSHATELTVLTATYPAATLGLPGDQPVTVAIELTGTSLRSLSYATPDGTGSSRTDISPLVDTTPNTSPST
jgi:hypothetical protein